jgi:zinc transport system ATP-binding protein
MDALLDIRDVSLSYRDRVVLDGVTLTVARGGTLGVIGPNGAGKTSLLKIILGIVSPTRGSVLIDGLSPKQATRRGLVGYLPQSPTIATNLPIDTRQLIELGLAGRVGMLHSIGHEDRQFIAEMIEQVGLADELHTPIGRLSGGQLQRALIVRALASRPKLLLLDEPTIGIDSRGQQEFMRLLSSLKSKLGLTIVFVSHDLRAVTGISDRIACVSKSIHFHDVPQHMPGELVHRMFACDLDALGIEGQRAALTPLCADPACDGHHHLPLAPVAAVQGPLEFDEKAGA